MIKGFNKNLRATDSLATRKDNYQKAIDRDIQFERTPYAMPSQVSKGTLQTNLGGVLQLKDATGGTNVFTYDPETGTVTILGGLVAQQVNSGTYQNIVIAGTNSVTGTLNNGNYGTPQITGGTVSSAVFNNPTVGTPTITGGTFSVGILANNTIGTPALTGGTLNPSVYQRGGTVGVTGTAIFVKNLVPGDLGTLVFMGGILTSIS